MASEGPDKAARPPEAVGFIFTAKPSSSNYGDCAGEYCLSEVDGTLNGKPVYLNEETENFLGFNGSQWVITPLAQKDRFIRHQKRDFKGYHTATGLSGLAPDDCTWSQYIVERRVAMEVLPQPNAIVRIQGLISAQHLNGMGGVCQELDSGCNRWVVSLQDGTSKLLKPQNLLVCRLPPTALQEQAAVHESEEGQEALPEVHSAIDEKPEAAGRASEPLKANPSPEGLVPVEGAGGRRRQSLMEGAAAVEGAAKPRAEHEKALQVLPVQRQVNGKLEGMPAPRVELVSEVVRLYKELEGVREQGRRMAEAGKAQGPQLRDEAELLVQIRKAEAPALAELAAQVSRLRSELAALGEERQRAWRAEEEERLTELDQRQRQLEARLQRLEAAAERVESLGAEARRAEASTPQRHVPAALPTQSAGSSSLMRKMMQLGATNEPVYCAACGAAAEQRASVDGLKYCSWCWAWWEGQRRGQPQEVSGSTPGAGFSAQEPGPPRGETRKRPGQSRCFWDERAAADSEENAGLKPPVQVRLVAPGASAGGRGMRLLTAASSLAGSLITEAEAATLHWELPRDGMDEEEPTAETVRS